MASQAAGISFVLGVESGGGPGLSHVQRSKPLLWFTSVLPQILGDPPTVPIAPFPCCQLALWQGN